MSEREFFEALYPKTNYYINLKKVDIEIVHPLEYWDKPRTKEEGPVCECVGENTNKALFEYFSSEVRDSPIARSDYEAEVGVGVIYTF